MLRDELRKVQASAALLEKQRGLGTSYWSGPVDAAKSSTSSNGTRQSTVSGSPKESKTDGDINLQYLKNIILQFLEHKDMRVSGLEDFIDIGSNYLHSHN